MFDNIETNEILFLFLTLGAVKESLEIHKKAVALNIILLQISSQRGTCSYSASKDLVFDFVSYFDCRHHFYLKLFF